MTSPSSAPQSVPRQSVHAPGGEVSRVTLTDFLLARIAEDEANLPDGFDCWYPPERYVAECEAKRQIVERHSVCDDVSYGDASSCPDLRALALPYADHPDYREEWKR